MQAADGMCAGPITLLYSSPMYHIRRTYVTRGLFRSICAYSIDAEDKSKRDSDHGHDGRSDAT